MYIVYFIFTDRASGDTVKEAPNNQRTIVNLGKTEGMAALKEVLEELKGISQRIEKLERIASSRNVILTKNSQGFSFPDYFVEFS